MTHEELVQFAAEKIGVEIAYADDGLGWQYMSEDHEGWWDFDLTSPDLFFKGLAVFVGEQRRKDGGRMSFGIDTLGRLIHIYSAANDEYRVKKNLFDISNIPILFWECWAELEGGRG